MKLPQLSLRDLFWLVLVVACLCWVWVEWRQRAALRAEFDALRKANQSETRIEGCEGEDLSFLLQALADNLGGAWQLDHDDRGWAIRRQLN